MLCAAAIASLSDPKVSLWSFDVPSNSLCCPSKVSLSIWRRFALATASAHRIDCSLASIWTWWSSAFKLSTSEEFFCL